MKQPTLLQFRKQLANALIYNKSLPKDAEITPDCRSKRQIALVGHHKETAPHYAKSFVAGKWDTTAAYKYQKYTCKAPKCSKQVHRYCACAIGHWLCEPCLTDHMIEASKDDDSD